MTSFPAALVIRDAIPRDCYSITRVLTAAVIDTRWGRWLDPDGKRRPEALCGVVAAAVTRVIESGIVRVIEDDGRVVAAALWSLDVQRTLPPARDGDGCAGALAKIHGRWKLVDEVAQCRRPVHVPHQQLVYLGVHPDRQGRGLGSQLLIGHHALLHVIGVGAYAIADEANRALLLRHGYTPIGPPRLLPGRVPVWAMWRPSSAAALQ